MPDRSAGCSVPNHFERSCRTSELIAYRYLLSGQGGERKIPLERKPTGDFRIQQIAKLAKYSVNQGTGRFIKNSNHVICKLLAYFFVGLT